jgi:hypothetical protein
MVVVVVVVEDRVAASGVMKLLLVQDALMVDKRDNISVSGDASLRLRAGSGTVGGRGDAAPCVVTVPIALAPLGAGPGTQVPEYGTPGYFGHNICALIFLFFHSQLRVSVMSTYLGIYIYA